MKAGPRNVGFYDSSKQLQSNRVHRELPKIQEDNRSKGRVHVPAWWFELDAFGAAVEAIRMACEHGLASGSIGVGAETQMLKKIKKMIEEA